MPTSGVPLDGKNKQGNFWPNIFPSGSFHPRCTCTGLGPDYDYTDREQKHAQRLRNAISQPVLSTNGHIGRVRRPVFGYGAVHPSTHASHASKRGVLSSHGHTALLEPRTSSIFITKAVNPHPLLESIPRSIGFNN